MFYLFKDAVSFAVSEIFIFQLLKEEKGLCITFECEILVLGKQHNGLEII